MAEGKWITGLRDDMPALAAARHVLLVRLSAVRERLPAAVFEAHKDVEHVHQLRVSTRRAGAALKIFGAFLPGKSSKKVGRALRGVRRSAGAARDWDVFLEDIAGRLNKAAARQKAGLDFLVGIGVGQRMAAQQTLVEHTQNPPLELATLITETLTDLRLPDELGEAATLRDVAIPQLSTLLGELDEAAKGDLEDYGHLHQVRIQGKRLRYAMEVFECCFEDEFRETIYPAIEEMQEILGLANDSHVAEARLEGIKTHLQATQALAWKRCQPALDALLRFHRKRLPEQRKLFLEWWERWRRSGSEAAFATLLKRETTAA